MTVPSPAWRFSPTARRLPGAQCFLVESLAAAEGASALAQPAFERRESVEIR